MSLDQQVSELTARVRRLEKREPPLAGTFIDSATTPADDLRVIAPDWDDGEHAFGPVRWHPIGGALPQVGDECMIVERSDGVWAVAGWWSDSQGTGIAQSTIDALDARLDALEAEAKGQASAVGTGAVFADVTVTDNLGTASKRGVCSPQLSDSTFTADGCLCEVVSTTTNTTTLRALTRLNGNIGVGLTVAVNYRIWKA